MTGVTGRVFEVEGGVITIGEGYRRGARVEKGGRWEAGELGAVVKGLVEETAVPLKVYGTLPGRHRLAATSHVVAAKTGFRKPLRPVTT